jgi:hypothetical protein
MTVKKAKPKLTVEQKYRQLKRHTENAGMTVKEEDGKIVVSRKSKTSKGRK